MFTGFKHIVSGIALVSATLTCCFGVDAQAQNSPPDPLPAINASTAQTQPPRLPCPMNPTSLSSSGPSYNNNPLNYTSIPNNTLYIIPTTNLCVAEVPILPCNLAGTNVGAVTGCCLDNNFKKMVIQGVSPPAASYSGGTLGYVADPLARVALDKSGVMTTALDALFPIGNIPTNGTQGVMPNIPMPHKDTPALPLVYMYPWLYKYTDQGHQYFLYRGTGNNTASTINSHVVDANNSLNPDNDDDRNAGNGVSVNTTAIATIQCQAPNFSCTKTDNGNTSADGSPDYPNFQYWSRLVRDSCTNQYILPMGLNPNYVHSSTFMDHNYPWDESFCQPMVMTQVPCLLDIDDDATGKSCLVDYGESGNDQGNTIKASSGYKKTGFLGLGGHKYYTNWTPNYKAPVRYDYRAWGYLERAWIDVLASSYAPSNYVPANAATGTAASGNPNTLAKVITPTSTNPNLDLDNAVHPSGSGTSANTVGTISLPKPIDGYESYGLPFKYNQPGSWDIGMSLDPHGKCGQQCSPIKTANGTQLNFCPGGNPGPAANNENCPPYNTWSTGGRFLGTLTTINQLAQRPYERIWDPTHPFSPRWDIETMNIDVLISSSKAVTDRDYSRLTWLARGQQANMLAIPGSFSFIGTAISDVIKAAIPIARGYNTVQGGDGNASDGNTQPGGCYVRCASVPVDILTFRASAFNTCMSCRIQINADCFWSEVFVNILPLYIDAGPVTVPVGGGDMYDGDEATALQDTIEGKSPTDEEFFPGKGCKTLLMQQNNSVYKMANQSGSDLADATSHKAGNWPPCSTQFDSPVDNVPDKSPSDIVAGQCSGCLASTQDYDVSTATGSMNNYANGNNLIIPGHRSSVTKCCSDLAQAVAPLNTLRIRNWKDNPNLKDDQGHLAEGYAFADYFGTHMPYMRWWDTGVAAGGVDGGLVPQGGAIPNVAPLYMFPHTNYDPLCAKGQYDVIVGIGTEADGGSPGGICRYGGGGGHSYKCITIGNPDRLTSWYELKQYQTNAMRDFGLNCLPIYEKMWKPAGAEDGALFGAGKHADALAPEPGQVSTTPSITAYEYNGKPWPLRWRGYISDAQKAANGTYARRFPNFDMDKNAAVPLAPGVNNTNTALPSGSLMVGLDNAQVGDIVFITHADPAAQTTAAVPAQGNTAAVAAHDGVMPFIAVVTSASHHSDTTSICSPGSTRCVEACGIDTTCIANCALPASECSDPTATCSDSITISDLNYGKYPDACGNTDYVGYGQTRTIYKMWLPTNVQDELFVNNGTNTIVKDSCGDTHSILTIGTAMNMTAAGNCADPKYTQCTFSPPGYQTPGDWNTIQVYRPSLDERGD